MSFLPFPLASFIKIFLASFVFPLLSNHLGDSGIKLEIKKINSDIVILTQQQQNKGRLVQGNRMLRETQRDLYTQKNYVNLRPITLYKIKTFVLMLL